MRGRGLKLPQVRLKPLNAPIAPHAGAWIETLIMWYEEQWNYRRPSCGGVD